MCISQHINVQICFQQTIQWVAISYDNLLHCNFLFTICLYQNTIGFPIINSNITCIQAILIHQNWITIHHCHNTTCWTCLTYLICCLVLTSVITYWCKVNWLVSTRTRNQHCVKKIESSRKLWIVWCKIVLSECPFQIVITTI